MPELPRISGDQAIKIFKKLGFYEARQKGSHVVMRKENKGCVIPRHKNLAVGTLKNAIRQAGISVDEFAAAYEEK
ncbi:MAG: addiction module toxin, HicA family [Desulfobacteraceae bacterium]|jgi:predicted RNA binding protein YcfA (HicA-like mRNA interferase family)|nr:MAG: addiction module toxin, HicA family [Desulfobacteraceae bacterium]